MPFDTVPVYVCPSCGTKTSHPFRDGYGDQWCPNAECVGELNAASFYRPSAYVTVAVYEVTRQYGGAEEGGWYYDQGSLVRGTARSFLAEDAPQAEIYRDVMQRRAEAENKEQARYGFGQPRLAVRTWVEQEAPAAFPAVQPRYC